MEQYRLRAGVYDNELAMFEPLRREAVASLQLRPGASVLDVGCGSGYHLWRMRGEGAECVVGIDPSQLFYAQFQAIKHFNPDPAVNLIPSGIDEMPALKQFDTVFSMGVLYHRRSPLDFLQQVLELA